MKLQTSITVLTVGLIFVALAALGTSSYYFSRNSAIELRSRILRDTQRDLYGEIGRLLDIARRQIDFDRNRIAAGALTPTDFPALVRSWRRALEIHPELAFFALALDSGHTLRMGRSENGKFYLQEWRFDAAAKKHQLNVFHTEDYPNRPLLSTYDERVSDLRLHPIVRTGRQALKGQALWTETYGFLGEHGFPSVPGTACVVPAYLPDGSRVGLLAVGVDVLSLCSYLQTLKVGEQGYVFVVELIDGRPSTVVAHPSVKSVWQRATEGPQAGNYQPVPWAEIDDLLVRAFMAPLPTEIDTSHDAKFEPIDFTFEGERYCGGYQYLQDRPDGHNVPEWLICILMPEREIMANVWRNESLLLVIGLTTLALGTVASLYLAQQVARPLEQVVGETRAIGQLHCEPRPPITSHVSEVGDLGVAVEEMKTNLRSFQKYVPADLVRSLLLSKQVARLGGELRTLTIFFSDIADFTTIAEQLSPHELVRHLGEYLGAMSGEVGAAGGTVDKYVGDAIMAFWGAPIPNERHALAACTAALRCQAVLRELRSRWQEAGKPTLATRIGLNTGEVVVGNIGSEMRLNYTVIGDAVNVASRLEGLNKFYGTEILVSESTFLAAGLEVVARPLDLVSVKGKRQAFLAYELLGLRGGVAPDVEDMVKSYAEALDRYRHRDWDEAIRRFGDVLRLRPDDLPSQCMIARCRSYKEKSPPAEWDAVNRLSEK